MDQDEQVDAEEGEARRQFLLFILRSPAALARCRGSSYGRINGQLKLACSSWAQQNEMQGE